MVAAALLLELTSFCEIARAQDSSAGVLTYSRAGSVVRVSDQDKTAHAFWYHTEPRFALRLDVAVPLDDQTRRAALVRRSSLATGFQGYLFLGYTNVTDGSPPAPPAPARPEDGLPDSEDGLQLEYIGNWHPIFFELGAEVAVSYDRYELRRTSDLLAAPQWENNYAVDVGARFFGFRQLNADVTIAWVIRAGVRGARSFDTRGTQICMPIIMGAGSRCDGATLLDGDITEGIMGYARGFVTALVRVGAGDEASLGFTVGVESLNLAASRSIAATCSAWAFVAPRLTVTALFGLGLEVTDVEATGSAQVVPSIIVGGALPWRDDHT